MSGGDMQFAKDSFFLALQERSAALNPSRTAVVNGATVPAVLVTENLPPSFSEPAANAFYVSWGAAQVVAGGLGCGTLMSIEAAISYYSLGSVASMVDRGRLLGQLDSELMNMCQPPNTEKRDYTQSPSVDMGTRVFWSQPSFETLSDGAAVEEGVGDSTGRVCRRARMTVYFWSEVTPS
jgi:hypothetical protein